MSLEEGVREESTALRVVRGMNTIRIPMYLCVVWIQFVLMSEAVAEGNEFDGLNVLIPIGLAALDAIMVTWIKDRKKGVSIAGFILSCLSLTAALNSLRQYPWGFIYGLVRPLTIHDFFMIWLALMITLVSVVELSAILFETQQKPTETLDSPYVIRTYET